MSLTQGLAIIGAVTGTTGALLGIMSFVRDRARLLVRGQRSGPRTGEDGEEAGGAYYLDMYVINAGRQPVAIVHAGILMFPKGPPLIARPLVMWFLKRGGLPGETGAVALSPISDEPVVMRPGELRKFAAKGVDFEFGRTRPSHPEVYIGTIRIPLKTGRLSNLRGTREFRTYLYVVDALGRVRAETIDDLGGLPERWHVLDQHG